MAWHSIIGQIGAFLIVASFALVQMRRIDARSLSYNPANFIGASFVLVSLYFDFNLSAAIVESLWVLTSGYGLLKAGYSARLIS